MRSKFSGALFASFIMAILLDLLIMPLRGGYIEIEGLTSTQLCNLFYAELFTPFTYNLLKYFRADANSTCLAIAIFIGANILQSIVYCYDWAYTNSTFWGIPVKFIAITLGFIIYKIGNTNLRNLFIIFYIIIGILISIPCTSWWENYTMS